MKFILGLFDKLLTAIIISLIAVSFLTVTFEGVTYLIRNFG